MTIAISIKVFDGLVLAADSASTVQLLDEARNVVGVSAVYNNANKIFNLRKGLPIGAVTWGVGSVGVASTATLMKDFRAHLSGMHSDKPEWELDPNNYSIEEVVARLFQFIYKERYVPAFQGQPQVRMPMGFIIGGYSSKEELSEEFLVEIDEDGSCNGPSRLRPKEEAGGISWNGQPEAIYRILLGFGTSLPTVLEQHLGIAPDQIPQVLDVLKQALSAQLVTPGMPIQDAIDLAGFLADLTAQFSRFTPGPVTVGGPIELATITKLEGFKWVRRKHYYRQDLNPEERQ